MEVLTSPFPRQACSASLFALLLAFAIGVGLQPFLHGNRVGLLIIGSLSVLLLVGGLILGVTAAIQTWHFRDTGVFAKGLLGAISNGLFIAAMIAFFPWMVSSHGKAVRPAAGSWFHAIRGLQPRTPDSSAQATYDKDGIRFSYDKGWTINDQSEVFNVESGFLCSRVIEVADRNAGMDVVIATMPFDPARSKPSLARTVRDMYRLPNPPVTNFTGNLGGVRLPGVIFRFKNTQPDGSAQILYGNFLLIENPRERIVVGAICPENINREPVDAVLASLKIEGVNNVEMPKRGDPSKPHVQSILYTTARATALIDNKTVAVGDEIDGCRIVGIGKDWVSVQLPGGMRKVLQIGDNIE